MPVLLLQVRLYNKKSLWAVSGTFLYLQCGWCLQSSGFGRFSPRCRRHPCECRSPRRGDSPLSPASSWNTVENEDYVVWTELGYQSHDQAYSVCTSEAYLGVKLVVGVEGVSPDVQRPCPHLGGCQPWSTSPQRCCFLSRYSCDAWGPTGWRNRSAPCCILQKAVRTSASDVKQQRC